MDEAAVDLIIIGGGGHAQEAAWVATRMQAEGFPITIIGYCDDDPAKKGRQLHGFPILGPLETVDATLATKPSYICGIGNNRARQLCVERAVKLGWTPYTLIDPSVIIASTAHVGLGTYVGAGSILSPNSRIGAHVLINQHCTIGHDSILEDFTQVSPGGRISGGCHLEQGTFIGSNAVVAPGVRVGTRAVIGATAFAIRDTQADTTALGSPAKTVYRHPKQ